MRIHSGKRIIAFCEKVDGVQIDISFFSSGRFNNSVLLTNLSANEGISRTLKICVRLIFLSKWGRIFCWIQVRRLRWPWGIISHWCSRNPQRHLPGRGMHHCAGMQSALFLCKLPVRAISVFANAACRWPLDLKLQFDFCQRPVLLRKCAPTRSHSLLSVTRTSQNLLR